MKLEVKNLTKVYDNGKGIHDISFVLENGIYGLLGPNGAGKSTLIKVLTGLLKQDSGQIIWNEEEITKSGHTFYEKIGYAPQSVSLYTGFSANRYLAYIAALKGMEKMQAKQEAEVILKRLDLWEVRNQKIETFSGGMKQRLLVAQAIIGNPQILILDEPASGLDPGQRISLRNYIAEIAEHKIVLLATHIVADVEQIADEVIFLGNGTILRKGNRQDILKQEKNCKNMEELYLQVYGEDVVNK